MVVRSWLKGPLDEWARLQPALYTNRFVYNDGIPLCMAAYYRGKVRCALLAWRWAGASTCGGHGRRPVPFACTWPRAIERCLHVLVLQLLEVILASDPQALQNGLKPSKVVSTPAGCGRLLAGVAAAPLLVVMLPVDWPYP